MDGWMDWTDGRMDDEMNGRQDWFRGSFISSLSPGASPLLPYNCCSIPFKNVPALLLHPRLILPPQEPKLLACASLAIFSYCPSGLRVSFMTSLLYLATVRSYCSFGLRGSFILPLIYVMTASWKQGNFLRIMCQNFRKLNVDPNTKSHLKLVSALSILKDYCWNSEKFRFRLLDSICFQKSN